MEGQSESGVSEVICEKFISGEYLFLKVKDHRGFVFTKKPLTSPSGRENLRQRTAVEHSLAHIASRKGSTARYIGARRNLFDLHRAAAIQNLEGLQRLRAA